MLMPIIAAVGSFVVSERILKPKATALFVLVCLAVYDIFISPPQQIVHEHRDTAVAAAINSTKNIHNVTHHDNKELDEFWDYDTESTNNIIQDEDDLATSFRCYRGPALLAITLYCASYCLRVWRRNGVACDELIFLPGTPHEFRCTGAGGDGDKISKSSHGSSSGINKKEEGMGGSDTGGCDNSTIIIEEETNDTSESELIGSPIKSCFSEGDAAGGSAKSPHRNRPASRSFESLTTIDSSPSGSESHLVERLSRSAEMSLERRPLMIESGESNNNNSVPRSPSSKMQFIRDQAIKGIDMLVIRKSHRPPSMPSDEDLTKGESSSDPASPNNEVYDAEYAPSGPSVLGAALDLSLPVLFNFHMFVVLMKDHYRKEAQSEEHDVPSEDSTGDVDGKVDVTDYAWMTPPQVPPKVLPLFFITPLIIRSMVPPRQRRRFYKTVLQGTILTPFRPVRFRDAFVADVVTSLVRPIADLFYALAYYFTCLFGVFGKHGLTEAGLIVSESRVLHGLILPGLSIMPLFIKFLQTLRQAYDTGKRWPYLGNAFKYLTAGLVILYGITHAAGERSPWWTWSFVLATIYQIIWDSCIDWELLVIVPRETYRKRTSSPIVRLCSFIRDVWEQIRLRPKRLFHDDSFYWKALFVNAGLRFCWMTGFIPAYRVSIYDGSTQVTFVDKAHGWSFVLLATLEIFRRSIWAIIKVELETIKLTGEGHNDLAMASIADEYIRDGKWNVPADALKSKVSNWRCRSSKSSKTTLEEDTKVVWLISSPQNNSTYSKLDQTDSAGTSLGTTTGQNSKYSKLDQTDSGALTLDETPINLTEKKRYRWLCISVSSGFLRWLFILELLLWPFAFVVLSYYVTFAE